MNNRDLNNFKGALFVAIFYLILGIAWIYFSDSAVKAISTDKNSLTLLQTYKGFFYVISTAIILYFLVLYFLKKQSEAMKIIEFNQELYNNIISSVENLLFVKDLDGVYIACNKAFEKFTGKSKDEIIGKTDYDIFDKEDAEFFREYDKSVLLKNNPESNFEWVADFSASKRYFLTVKAPLVDSQGKILGIVGNTADLTEQKEIEEALVKSQKRYEAAEKIGKVGAWEYDVNTQYFWASAESRRIYGFSADSDKLSTESVENCVPERERIHQALENLLEKGTEYNLEFEIHPSDGSSPKIISSIAEVEYDEENKPKKVLGFIQDITELKKKDDLMIVQSRHAAMGEMIGMIAHQWRQPLAVISMDMNNILIDIALNDLKTSDVEKCANNVLKHTQNLSKTIDDFRNFFRPDKATSRVKIQDVLEETYSIIHDSLTNNNIELKTSYLSESEVDIYPRELMQVFINIFNNAKDALLTYQINDACIDVKVYEDEEYIITDICDNGLGVEETILPKIFDLYFSTKDEKSGTGVGLYMSKLIIEEHLHGKIEAFNTSNGICFRTKILKIPIEQDAIALKK